MTIKNNGKSQKIKKGGQGVPKIPWPAKNVVHGLFYDPRNHRIDGRSRIAWIIRDVTKRLLECFPDPVSAGALLIARQCAYKALRIRAFEHSVLTGDSEPAKTTDDAYLSLSASLTKDVEVLHRMAKESSPIEKVPSLGEYLEAIKSGKLVAVEPGKPEEGEG